MELRKAERQRAKIRLGLQGPSGSGKTYSSLLIAFGLSKDWKKVAVIDSENHSAELYSHLGGYNVLNIEAPFTPEKFIEAIRVCESAKMEVIIIDSISAQWAGSGGILDIHDNMSGNSFTNWSKITPRHNHFVQMILQSPAHTIVTIRSKQDYVITEKNNKQVPEKIGLKGIQRDGFEYDLTIVLDLDIKHNANASKDRTALFMGKPEFKITSEIGQRILTWCNEPGEIVPEIPNKFMVQRINACKSISELLDLYKTNPEFQQSLLSEFTKRRQLLTVSDDLNNIINQQNLSTNGIINE